MDARNNPVIGWYSKRQEFILKFNYCLLVFAVSAVGVEI